MSLSQRVGSELGDELSSAVSYQVRYDTDVSAATKIKFMTDGILLREICSDLLLTKYSVLIIDEAHERGINTDILLGLLSRVAMLRSARTPERPLKVVIMSATLRLDDFVGNTRLFPDEQPTVIHVEARQYPVDVHFQKETCEVSAVVETCARKVRKIHA
jgi:ATP-dependent RNA helicase DHX37/DHR1